MIQVYNNNWSCGDPKNLTVYMYVCTFVCLFMRVSSISLSVPVTVRLPVVRFACVPVDKSLNSQAILHQMRLWTLRLGFPFQKPPGVTSFVFGSRETAHSPKSIDEHPVNPMP